MNAESIYIRKNLAEFFRYAFVGGVAFGVDAGVLFLTKESWFSQYSTEIAVFWATAAGFVCGLICNYFLSQWLVFRTEKQRKRGLTGPAFVQFLIVGLIGLGLTEMGMYIGVRIVGAEGLWYLLVKCFVAGLVLIWNYLGRKIWIYRGL